MKNAGLWNFIVIHREFLMVLLKTDLFRGYEGIVIEEDNM